MIDLDYRESREIAVYVISAGMKTGQPSELERTAKISVVGIKSDRWSTFSQGYEDEERMFISSCVMMRPTSKLSVSSDRHIYRS